MGWRDHLGSAREYEEVTGPTSLQKQERVFVFRTQSEGLKTFVKSCKLTLVAMREEKELHVSDVSGPNQPGPLCIAQIPHIHIHRPILMIQASAILLQTNQRLSHRVTGTCQSATNDAEISCLG